MTAICDIPLDIIDFETKIKGQMICISKLRNNFILIDDCCQGCVNFVIRNYSSAFLIDI